MRSTAFKRIAARAAHSAAPLGSAAARARRTARRRRKPRRLGGILGALVLVAAVAAAGVGATAATGERSGGAGSAAYWPGYSFDTGQVKHLFGANANYWAVSQVQGTFCGGQPLGEPWHVWGTHDQYSYGSVLHDTRENDGTIVFDAQGKQVKRSLTFPWFVQEMSLHLSASPPTASVWLWNGQFVSRQEVVVELKQKPECAPTITITRLDGTPEPAVAGMLLTGKATVVVTRAGAPSSLASTAKVSWKATVAGASLKQLSKTRVGGVLRATWKLPKAVKAKTVRLSVTVASEGTSATKAHLHRVK
jgi:hypothetical protein